MLPEAMDGLRLLNDGSVYTVKELDVTLVPGLEQEPAVPE
jgi:hypothetical protein